MMHAFIIAAGLKEAQEQEVTKILSPHKIEPVDVTRIVGQNSIGIGELAQLRRTISLAPFKSKMKTIIIEEAQTLTIEAQNAFLKTLEEPPDHTIIILLVSTNADNLLPTILSRCQIIDLSAKTYHLKPEDLSDLSSELSALMEGGRGKRMALAEEVAKDKQVAISWLADMILVIRQTLLEQVTKGNTNYSITQLLNYARSFQRAHTLLSTTNINPRFTLEMLFFSI